MSSDLPSNSMKPSIDSAISSETKNKPPSSSDFWLPWMTGVGIGFILIFGAALVCWCMRHRLARKFTREGLKFRPNSSNNSSGALILQGQYHALMHGTNTSSGQTQEPNSKAAQLAHNLNSTVVQMSSLLKASPEKPMTIEMASLNEDNKLDCKPHDDVMLDLPRHSEFIGSKSSNASPVKLISLTTPKFRNNSTRSSSSKGLLKSRRGSQTSLTISFSPSMDSLHSKSALDNEILLLDSQQNFDLYSTSPLLCNRIISRRDSRTVLEHMIPTGHRFTLEDIRKELVDNPGEFSKEFWSIPMNHASKKDIALAGIGNKNRYQTILPNESTRVLLSEQNDDPLSSYINANFIRGYCDKQNAFIATQGPMSHTIADFWRMVWETECPAIIMITNLIEKKRRKCEDYLPANEGESDIYGSISVTVVRVEDKDGFTVRKVKLKIISETDETDSEERECVHFWFTSWPDHATPSSPSQLLKLVEASREYTYWPSGEFAENGETYLPVIVHCSAGLGRTGCFICLSVACDMLRCEQYVDLLAILCSIRLDRGGLVQSGEQFEFLYKTLACLEDCYSPYVINESYEASIFSMREEDEEY